MAVIKEDGRQGGGSSKGGRLVGRGEGRRGKIVILKHTDVKTNSTVDLKLDKTLYMKLFVIHCTVILLIVKMLINRDILECYVTMLYKYPVFSIFFGLKPNLDCHVT